MKRNKMEKKMEEKNLSFHVFTYAIPQMIKGNKKQLNTAQATHR